MTRTALHDQEIAWVRRAQRGDDEAFTQLVAIYQKPVYNLCYRMLGNARDAEDAAQESFYRAYRAMDRYDIQRKFSTWLLSIASHYCIDQLRRRRLQMISIEDLPRPEIPSGQIGPEIKVQQMELERRVRSLLDVLGPKDRAAVIMRYWYDFSYEEIAQALSLSLSAVKSRLHRARRKLAENWQKDTPDNFLEKRECHGTSAI